MNRFTKILNQFGNHFSIEPMDGNTYRIYAPFFHEDGDMYSIYLEDSPNGLLKIRDFGNTIMRLSYTYELDTKNKLDTLNNIVKSNDCIIEDFELILPTTLENLPQSIFKFSQLISKVSNIDIITKQIVKSKFYEYLNEFLLKEFKTYNIQKDVIPIQDPLLKVDYQIPAPKPIFIFGVNENTKASKVVISCLTFQKYKIPFRSLVVHEDFEGLTAFNRNQITNAADKQYVSLDDFKNEGVEFVQRELAS